MIAHYISGRHTILLLLLQCLFILTVGAAGAQASYWVNGEVTDYEGWGVDGAAIYKNGILVTTSGPTGDFGFFADAGESFAITAQAFCRDFTSYQVTNLSANIWDADLQCLGGTTFEITGRVLDSSGYPVSGVQFFEFPYFPGTDYNGEFSLTASCYDIHFLTPYLECMTFQPACHAIFHPIESDLQLDFVAQGLSYEVKGVVHDEIGHPLSGVKIDGFSPNNVYTDSDGVFARMVPCGSSYTLSAEAADHTFTPAQIAVGPVSTNVNLGEHAFVTEPGLEFINEIELQGWAKTIAASGSYIYCGAGGRLHVINCSDGDDPVLVGSTNVLTGTISDFQIEGCLAYIICHYSSPNPPHLVIVDLSDPSAPTVTGSVALQHSPEAISVWENTVYVADLTNLIVFDVSDPSAPTEITRLETSGLRNAVVCYPNLYVSSLHTLYTYGIANPVQPLLLGSVPLDENAHVYAMKVKGTTLYVPAMEYFYTFDISSPSSPQLLDTLYQENAFWRDVAFADQHAYLAYYGQGVTVVNITNPSNLISWGTSLTEFHTSGHTAYQLAVNGSNLYLAASAFGGMSTCSILDSDVDVSIGSVADITAVPGHEKVTVSWTDPSDTDLDEVEVWRGLWHDSVDGSSVYPEYSHIPTSTVPSRPATRAEAFASQQWSLVGTVDADTEVFVDEIVPRGIYYYEVFPIDERNNVGAAAVANDLATNYYLGDVEPGGAYDGWVDISDFAAFGASYNNGEGDEDYNAECDIATATPGKADLGIPQPDDFVGASDIARFAANFNQVSPNKKTIIAGSPTAYLTSIQNGSENWSLRLMEPCSRMKVIRLRLDVVSGDQIDIQLGEMLRNASNKPFVFMDRAANDICVAAPGAGAVLEGDGVLFEVNMPRGKTIDDIEIEIVGPDFAAVEHSLDSELSELPSHYDLVGNYPNPFNPSTDIRFAVPSRQFVQLEVFDVRGHMIRQLLHEELEAGYHSISWDGRDGRGRNVAAGVYLARIKAGEWSDAVRMTLVK